MWNGKWLLIFIVVACLAGSSVVAKKYNVTVGYLPCIKGELRDRQGLMISGALSLALEEINNSTELLPEINLVLKWNDTRCDTVIATKLITDMSSSGVVAFFGPEGRCQTEANIAQSRNLPMISYKCNDYQASTLSTFARLNPPETQATKSVISLLRYYRWNKFSILYEESWLTAALSLEKHAKNNNMTVNYRRLIEDHFTCCEELMACCDVGIWRQVIQETKNKTRIYVFLGTTSGLIEMMAAMESLQLFEKGEYMVIFVDIVIYSPEETMKYLIRTEDRYRGMVCPNTPDFKKRAHSLLVVASSKPGSGYENFTSRVREYSSREPFNFPLPSVFGNKLLKVVSIYAAYLYDSVKLYATALHSLIQEDTIQKNRTLTYERLMSVATNGSRIVSRMITITPMKSVSGMSIYLDERADSVGSFSVLAFKPVNFNNDYVNCTYGMIPVGHFEPSTKGFPEYKLNPRLPIDWPDSVKPEDEPYCGFLKEKCPEEDSQFTLLMVAGTLAVTLICVLFCLLGIVKRRKRTSIHKARTESLLVAN